MKHLVQVVLMGIVVLAVASLAAAQGTFTPLPRAQEQAAVRLGNYIEVGNDVFMHIIALSQFDFRTTENGDFESAVRDRTASRNPFDTREQSTTGDFDGIFAILRFGVNFRYQKSLTLELVGEERPDLDGNITDSRANSTNPGGTDVFGRPATTENNFTHINRAWLDYKFYGTPWRIRVGYDLWTLDQAGTIGDNDPRFAVFGEFGDFDVLAAAVLQWSSQRLGLENDNDNWYYTFSGGYNLKPHRFQVDVVYFRDRFLGADTGSAVQSTRAALGFQGQKSDSVEIIGSWTSRLGPIRGLLQGALLTGRARGGVTGIPVGPGTNVPGREYSIFAGDVIAYAEADLGLVRPFVFGLFATADGDPRDKKLHGFTPEDHRDITLMTGTGYLAHLDSSGVFGRDYGCPGRAQGLGVNPNTPGSATVAAPFNSFGAPGLARTPANIGIAALGSTPGLGFAECSHTVANPFNDGLGQTSTLGLLTNYANPGTLVGFAGLRVFPLKGHELTGWYAYRGWVNSKIFNVAFAPERAARGIPGIHTTQYHEVGGFWLWTLNPYFDIRLAGDIGIAGGGYRGLAELATCDPGGAIPAGRVYATATQCSGKDVSLHAEARFRARF